LAAKFTGPYKILRLKDGRNAELVVNNGRKIVVNVQRLRPFLGFDVQTAANDLPSPRGGRGADDDVIDNDNEKEKLAQQETTTNSHFHTHTHTRGPLTRARAKSLDEEISTSADNQKNKPSMILARLDKKLVATLSPLVKRLTSVKRGPGKTVKKKFGLRQKLPPPDPYKYSDYEEVSASDEPDLGPAPANIYQDLLQWVLDFDDVDDSDGHESIDNDADTDGAAGQWIEDDDGWKSWRSEEDDWATARDRSDQELEDHCVRVFQETELFDQEFQTEVEDAQEFLSEEELQRRREEFRDRGLRLQRQIRKLRESVSPTVFDSACKRSPFSPRLITEAPLPRPIPAYRERGLKGRRLRFEDEVENEDERPVSTRTRRGTRQDMDKAGPGDQ
jgi:hypothetical protein